MSEDIMENKAETETAATENQEKTFSQADLDRIVADRVGREQRKFEKQLSGIDIDEAKQLLQDKEAAEIERQKSRGDFDTLLKSTVEKKDLEIQNYKSKLQTTLVDGALISSASQNNAVDPEQVSALLRHNLRLSEDGIVEVLDSKGTPRYNDSGVLLSTGELVSEFLTANPHHVRASQGGSGSQGNAGGSTQKSVSVADMVASWNEGGKEAFAAMKKKAT
tara:strand:+ start:989 stop:1651 length:663 start_codon:yes stop_codon:yes gene_type:complete